MLLNLLVLFTFVSRLAHGAAVPVSKENAEPVPSKTANITNASPDCVCAQATETSPRVLWTPAGYIIPDNLNIKGPLFTYQKTMVAPGVYAYTTNITNGTAGHWTTLHQRPRLSGSCTNPLTVSRLSPSFKPIDFDHTFSSRLRMNLTYWERQAVTFSMTFTACALLLAFYALVLAVYRCNSYRRKSNTICEEIVDTDNKEQAQEKISLDDGDEPKDSRETNNGQETKNNQEESIASVDEYLKYVGVVEDPVPTQSKLGKLAAEYKHRATED